MIKIINMRIKQKGLHPLSSNIYSNNFIQGQTQDFSGIQMVKVCLVGECFEVFEWGSKWLLKCPKNV